MARKALGRGLDALIPGAKSPKAVKHGVEELEIKDIKPNPAQPRKTFTAEKLEELIKSIKEHGVIEPIVVKESGNKYEIVVGERRYIAAQRAGLKTIPAIIKNISTMKQLEIALIENIMREDLNPVEEGNAYKQLMEGNRLTQEELAEKLGRNRVSITNTLRLLNLPKNVQNYVVDGRISMGHAKVLLGVDDATRQKSLCEHIVKKELSVRELEILLKKGKRTFGSGSKGSGGTKSISTEMKSVENELKFKFGTRINVKGSYKTGKIEIEYYSSEEFERILDILNIKP